MKNLVKLFWTLSSLKTNCFLYCLWTRVPHSRSDLTNTLCALISVQTKSLKSYFWVCEGIENEVVERNISYRLIHTWTSALEFSRILILQKTPAIQMKKMAMCAKGEQPVQSWQFIQMNSGGFLSTKRSRAILRWPYGNAPTLKEHKRERKLWQMQNREWIERSSKKMVTAT